MCTRETSGSANKTAESEVDQTQICRRIPAQWRNRLAVENPKDNVDKKIEKELWEINRRGS